MLKMITMLLLVEVMGAVAMPCDSSKMRGMPESTHASWCAVLSKCDHVGHSLLTSAINCTGVMRELQTSPESMCASRRCMSSLKALFESAVSMNQWRTAAKNALTSKCIDARVDEGSKCPRSIRALDLVNTTKQFIEQADQVMSLKAKSAYLVSSSATLEESAEATLNTCLTLAQVKESSLGLPMTIASLTGSSKLFGSIAERGIKDHGHQCSDIRYWLDAKMAYYVRLSYHHTHHIACGHAIAACDAHWCPRAAYTGGIQLRI